MKKITHFFVSLHLFYNKWTTRLNPRRFENFHSEKQQKKFSWILVGIGQWWASIALNHLIFLWYFFGFCLMNWSKLLYHNSASQWVSEIGKRLVLVHVHCGRNCSIMVNKQRKCVIVTIYSYYISCSSTTELEYSVDWIGSLLWEKSGVIVWPLHKVAWFLSKWMSFGFTFRWNKKIQNDHQATNPWKLHITHHVVFCVFALPSIMPF